MGVRVHGGSWDAFFYMAIAIILAVIVVIASAVTAVITGRWSFIAGGVGGAILIVVGAYIWILTL